MQEGGPMSRDPRTEAAIIAGARAMHENAREKHQFRWENASPQWQADMKAFVAPIVLAALAAAAEHDAQAGRLDLS